MEAVLVVENQNRDYLVQHSLGLVLAAVPKKGNQPALLVHRIPKRLRAFGVPFLQLLDQGRD